MAQLEEHSPIPAGGDAANPWAERARAVARRAAAATVDNPILVKEFRTRMRGTRAYWLLLGYTLLLSGVVAIMYFVAETTLQQEAQNLTATVNSSATRSLGQGIYYFVFVAQAVMVMLITPAITSGTITIEREQRSYELLVTTPLRPVDVIRGKLTAAVSFVVLLLTASLPLVSLSFLVGGVSPAEIFYSYLVLIAAAFLYGAIGVFWSATLGSTAISTVVTYLSVLIFSFVTMMFGAQGASAGASGNPAFVPFQALNPGFAPWRAVVPQSFFGATIPSLVPALLLNVLLGLVMAVAAMGRLEHFDPPQPAWLRGAATALWAGFALFLFGPILGGIFSSMAPPNSGTSAQLNTNIDYLLRIMLGLVCLVVPVFATGDLVVRRGESALTRYLRGFLPHRMFTADLSAGLPLMLAWAAFIVALIPLGIAAGNVLRLFSPLDVYLPGAILVLAVVFGLAGAGSLLSVILPSRWAACVLTYLFAVVTMLLPYFTLFPWMNSLVRPKSPQLLYQALYLVPFEGLAQLGNPASFRADHPAMLFDNLLPIWMVTSAIYVLVGVACFAFTAARINRQGQELQKRMEASEAALAAA